MGMAGRAALTGLLLAGVLVGCGSDETATTGGGATGGTGGAGAAGGSGGGGAPPEDLPPLPDVDGVTPIPDMNPDPHILEVDLVARPHAVQLLAGEATQLLNYNDQLPGPLLHARVGDQIIIHFKNELDEPTVVHWHGLRITDTMDGSPMIQNPVMPGETFTYDFVVPDAGTYWYHTHLHQIEQFEYGLYGAIVVHEKDFPVFSAERLFVADDIRLRETDNQVSSFLKSGPDIGMGRVGNALLVNGSVVNDEDGPLTLTIPRGGIERWRFIQATNALAYNLRIQGADVRVIATDGGLLPEPFTLAPGSFSIEKVHVAPGQRYDFEVRPKPDAAEVVLEALILTLDENDMIVEVPFELVRAVVEGEVTTPEPVYPAVAHPAADVAPAESLEWALSGGVVNNKVQFTINGTPAFVEGEHVLLDTFDPNVPIKITLSSNVSPGHPFHIHGQFFQILERDGQPVFEPGLRDTVYVRLQEEVSILSYFENPGQWMVHCHISEHAENGMMADIQVGPLTNHDH